jgi:hypothetical protein
VRRGEEATTDGRWWWARRVGAPLAGAILAAFLWLILVYWSGVAGGVVLAGLFVLPLLAVAPRGRGSCSVPCSRWRPNTT